MTTLRTTPLRVTTVLAAVTALALGIVAQATAATYPNGASYAQSVDLAGANWTTDEEGVFADLTISVSKLSETVADQPGRTTFPPSVTIFYDRWTTDADSGEVTHVTYTTFDGLPRSAFAFEPSLRSASASFATVLVDGTQCRYPAGPGGPPDGLLPAADDEPTCERLPDLPADVELTWTGQGETYRDASRTRATDTPLVRFFSHQLTAARDASVTARIEIDPEVLPPAVVLPDGDPDHGVLLRGRYREQFHAVR
jgi:hypothetical protein